MFYFGLHLAQTTRICYNKKQRGGCTMPLNASHIFTILFAALWLFVIVKLAVRAIRNRTAPVKTVKATVVDKQKTEHFSKYSGTGKRERYVVVFLAEGVKSSFYVSEFSWRGYRKGETGTLQYRGDKLIDFH